MLQVKKYLLDVCMKKISENFAIEVSTHLCSLQQYIEYLPDTIALRKHDED